MSKVSSFLFRTAETINKKLDMHQKYVVVVINGKSLVHLGYQHLTSL